MDSEETTKLMLGDPKKAIRKLALPLVVSLLVCQINVLADRAWCSGLGVNALAAVAVVTPIYFVMSGLGNGLGVGASAVISRYIGAGKPKDSSTSAVQALIFGVLFAAVLTVIMLFVQSDFLALIGADDVLDLCNEYMNNYTWFLIFIIINGVIAGILNGQGATRLSTIMMLVMAVSNIILDPIFIYVLDMGIKGASIATVIATIFSMLLGIYFIFSSRTYLKLDRQSLRYDKDHMHSVLVAGIPQMLEYAIIWGMNIVLNCIVISCAGSQGLTIYSTPDNVMDLLTIPALAIGSALVPVASSAYGQGDSGRMRSSFRYALILGLACVAGLCLLTEIFAEFALMPFTYSEEVSELKPQMVEAMRIMCLYVTFYCFTPLCSGYLQALGKPQYSVICAIWRNFVLIVFFAIAAQFSLTSIFWALVFGHIVGAATIYIIAHYTSKKVFRKMAAGQCAV